MTREFNFDFDKTEVIIKIGDRVFTKYFKDGKLVATFYSSPHLSGWIKQDI